MIVGVALDIYKRLYIVKSQNMELPLKGVFQILTKKALTLYLVKSDTLPSKAEFG
jgi:hypothetical protein